MAEEGDDEAAQMLAGTTVDAVSVDPAWTWIWRAWWRLHHGDRVWVGSMGPPSPLSLAWSKVREWADRHGYSDEDAVFLDACIQSMDSVFMDHHAEQQRIAEEQRKAGKP